MRTKEEILKDSNDHLRKAPNWDGTASLHERLTIEVLIDIRDILQYHLLRIGDLYSAFKEKD